MKASILVACLLPYTLSLTLAENIKIGQSEEEVIKILGHPVGKIDLRDKSLILYPQGEVTIKQDRVSHIDLMDAEEFAADQERLRVEREEWMSAQMRRAVKHTEEGRAIQRDKMQSQAFSALPAKDRVDYWRSFQIRYPKVDSSEQIAAALQGYNSELQELRSQQQIAALETRLANAEREAAAARLETEKLRKEAERIKKNNRFYGLRYYTDPVINRAYYYHTPKLTIFTSDGKTTIHKTTH